jgi:cell wall-associated NlpC family hydrolase
MMPPRFIARQKLAGSAIALTFVFLCCSCRVWTEPGKSPSLRYQITDLARHLCGIPYRLGGDDIDGFDCSGLVSYIYGCYGIRLPRGAREQAKLKRKVSIENAKPGDILIFRIRHERHSAIYLGMEHFIHAPKGNAVVREEELNRYWRGNLRSAINVID